MKKLIPFYITTIAPYLLIGIAAGIFSGFFTSTENETVNHYFFWGAQAFALLFYLVSVIISVITFTLSIKKKWDAEKLLRANMIVKLIQIPAYIAIFVLGICMLLTIFTYAIAILFWLLDCISVCSSGLIGMAGAIRGKSEGKFKTGFTVVSSILSYIFCVDVVMAVIMYVKYRKSTKKSMEVNINNEY